jgi:hypothetical protein
MMKDTAKDESKDAMALQLKDGIAKEDTNVTKVNVHKPAQRDSPDADPSKEKELLCNELIEGLIHNKPKKSLLTHIVPEGTVLFIHYAIHLLSIFNNN